MSVNALSIITDALIALGVQAQGEAVTAGDGQFMLRKLNAMVNAWCARSVLLYSSGFQRYTLTVNHQPHTIGLGTVLILTQVTAGASAVYAYSSFAGQAPFVGMTIIVTGFANPLNNVTGVLTAVSGGLSGTVEMAITTQVNQTMAALGKTAAVPDFACPVGRPVEIASASLILTTSTPNVDIPLRIRDKDWWARLSIKAQTSTLPTDLYYSPEFPNGSVYFWPIPTIANDIRLETRSLVSQFADMVTDYDFPFGYEDALVCSLAEAALVSYPRPETQGLIIQQARAARALIASVNTKSPSISTEIGGSGGRGWDIQTGGY